jgi:hypothetical protein
MSVCLRPRKEQRKPCKRESKGKEPAGHGLRHPNAAGSLQALSKARSMRRWFPIAIALAAAGAGSGGAPRLSFYLVLAAVPVTAVGALVAFGELLDARAAAPVEPVAALETLLFGVALLLLVAGAAAGSPAFAISGCLAVFGLQALLGLSVELRRPALEQR